MTRIRTARLAAAAFWIAAAGFLLPGAGAQNPDPMLRAMQDELERSRKLHIESLDPLYFIEYRVEDSKVFSATANLGALVSTDESETRTPLVRVRVGNYDFDNSDHIYSDVSGGTRYDPNQLSIDNNYLAFRHVLWLATDRTFKSAEDAIARKRSALKNMNVPDRLPDFSKAAPVEAVLPVRTSAVDQKSWKDRVVKLSAIFSGYPQVLQSGAEIRISQSTNYLVNSEGTVERNSEDLAYLRVEARGLAPDGTSVRDAAMIQAFDAGGLPGEAELRRQVTELAEHVAALAQAPAGEAYDGPMLFEATAAAQLFGQVLGDNLKVTRKPITEPGRTAPYVPSELESRIESRILPEWMDVTDDPSQTQFRGQTLLGHYVYDIEGVAPQPLTLVEKGLLKSFLLTRTPALKGFESSNGHARMTGGFGARAPGFGNLFIRASQTMPAADMKKTLIDMCQQRKKPYGILVRKLDYPSSASVAEFRRIASGSAQSGGARPVVLPLLVYKVYPDGKEELVRSVRFRDLSTKSFKDIVAASAESSVFNFVDNNAPFALMGAGSYTASSSVIAPAILFDELELAPVEEEVSKPPIVPAPPLSANSGS
ncbi:MAG: hypothetical protein LAP38_08275 [Acidobacteriia bacterium]|nr:hypothetical protein [Terriglobia bacterium]